MPDSNPLTHEARLLPHNPRQGYVFKDYSIVRDGRYAFKAGGDWLPVPAAVAECLRKIEADHERAPLCFEVRKKKAAAKKAEPAATPEATDAGDGAPVVNEVEDLAPAATPKPRSRSRSRRK